ncbi:hypothetical protein EG343_24865 [Chryseobacterium nakagawai]|uniref:Uncharacterized protein n=2 Tax=Chryseobacterium nakagawai TaxID=1241982 RepID=A0AAD1DTJ9_CHRNA|nr:hypothetical protein EG343_24865 [Chryseobacterium nakagawai]
MGINTITPQKALHINGSLQVVNEINVGGDTQTPGNAGTAGFGLVSNGPGQAPQWKDISETSDVTGTLIVVNGQFVVAQEITVQLSADYSGSANGSTVPIAIGNLSNKILDNQNKYTGTASSNSFQVANDGVYEVYLNMQVVTSANTYPTIGIWDNTMNNWLVNVNDLFVATSAAQTYTLITTVPMNASRTYSFRATNSSNYTIRRLSGGTTGSGPISQVTVKRLK